MLLIYKSSHFLGRNGGWLFLLTLFTFCLQLYFLSSLWLQTYHPLPLHDEWDTIEFLRQISINPLDIKPWFSLHNEHRLFVPRMVYAIDFWLFKGKFLFTFLVTTLLSIGIVVLFIHESRRLSIGVKDINLVGVSLASILLCGQQASNFIWAFQVQWFLVHFFTVCSAALVVSASREYMSQYSSHIQSKINLALFFTIAANYSTASGNLTWLSTGLAVLVLRDRLPKQTLITTTIVGSISVGLYLFGFHLSGTGTGSLSALWKDPVSGFIFFLAFLGVPFAPFGKITAIIFGGVFFVCFSFLFFKLIRNKFISKSQLDGFCFGLLAFVCSVGVVTTVGRLALGVDGAIESRFASVVSLGWASLILSLFPLLSGLQLRAYPITDNFIRNILTKFIVIIFIGSGIGGFLLPPYNYLPTVEIKETATSAIIAGLADVKALERVGFPDPVGIANSRVREFMMQSHRSIFSENKIPTSQGVHSLRWRNDNHILFNVDNPDFVNRISGLSVPETIGRWSNSKLVVIELNKNLPNSFMLDLIIGGFGPNLGREAQVIVGAEVRTFKITGSIENLKLEQFIFREVDGSDFIAIVVPLPTIANSINPLSTDLRPLGIFLQSITVRPI